MPKKPNKVMFKCHVCPNKYTRASYLDNHIRKCHPDDYDAMPKIEGTFRRVVDPDLFDNKYVEGQSAQAEPSQPKAPHGPAKAGDDPFAQRSYTHREGDCPCGRKHAPLTKAQQAVADVQPGDTSSKVTVFNVAERVAALREAGKAPEATVDPTISAIEAQGGAQILREMANQIRGLYAGKPSAADMEKLARQLEGVAFGFDFVYKDLQATDYWAVKEKAKKWDDLARILPTIETFLRLALETEAERVQAPDNH